MNGKMVYYCPPCNFSAKEELVRESGFLHIAIFIPVLLLLCNRASVLIWNPVGTLSALIKALLSTSHHFHVNTAQKHFPELQST
jgi:hypothetical protein